MKLNKKNVILLALTIITIIILSFLVINPNHNTSIINYKGDFVPYTDVYGENIIHQNFNSKVYNLQSISFQLGTYGAEFDNQELVVKMYDSNKSLIFEKNILAKNIIDCGYATFDFDKIEESALANYELEIACEKCNSNKKIAVFGIASSSEFYQTKINDLNLEYAMAIKLSGTNYNYSLIFVCISLLFIFIGALLNRKFIFDDKMKQKFKVISLISEFILSILFFIFILKFIIIANYLINISIIYLIGILIIGIILLYTIIFRIRNYNKIEQLFLTLMIIIGLGYLIFMIPNQVADENVHYYTAYNILSGDIFDLNATTSVPTQLFNNNVNEVKNYERLNKMMTLQPDFNELTKTTTSGYSSIFYLPAVFGVAIGKILNLPIYLGYYIARILSFIVFLAFAYYSIKLIPFGKLIIFTYLFNPMVIHQSISLSFDSLMNIFIILFVSYILKLLHDKEPVKKNQMIILSILTIIIGLTKYVYLPIALLPILLIKSKNKSNIIDKNNKVIIFSILVAIVICCGLFIYTSFFKNGIPSAYVTSNNISLSQQLKNLLYHPANILYVLFNTIRVYGTYYIDTFLGSSLGWLNISINKIIIYGYLLTLFLSIFTENDNEECKRIEKYLLSFVSIVSILLIIFGMYLTWSPVGSGIALGIQGRYFIPIIFMLLLPWVKKGRKILINNYELKFSLVLAVINFLTITSIIENFI